MYARILVPLDGSDLAQSILSQAVDLCLKLEATLVMLHVRDRHAGSKEAAQRYLEFVQQQYANNGLQTKLVVATGDVAAAILRTAEQEQIDLIAMATHGRSGIQRVVYGSVAEQVLRQSSKPVLLVRVVDAEASTPAPASRTPGLRGSQA